MVTVVPARYEHIPVLTLCFSRLTIERGERYPAIDQEELDRFGLLIADRIDRGHDIACCFVAETQEDPLMRRGLLGFVALQLSERQVGKPRRVAYMEWIGVTPGARRLGVGRQLVEAALDWAEARGVAHIEGNIGPGPDSQWAAGATDYARRQVITIAEARASVLVPKAERPPVGATHAPEPKPARRRRKKRANPEGLNGEERPEESLP